MRSVVLFALAVLALGLAGSPSGVDAAASPSPTPAASPAAQGFQVWLDAEVAPPDGQPGDVVEAGFTIWDPRRRELFAVGGLEARMRPAAGTAAASVGTIESDFPGHLIVEFAVPPGGPGAIELGTSGQSCTADGTCTDILAPVVISGTGPPPDADASLLVTAVIRPFAADLVAGLATPLTVDIRPRGLWDLSALPVPDHLVVVAGRRGARPVATADIRPAGAAGDTYTGALTVPDGGEFTLTVAVPGADGVDRPIDGSALTILVGGDPAQASASPAIAGRDTSSETGQAPTIPVIVWIVGIGTVLVGAAVVLRRALADL